MFERYAEKARRVIFFARYEASQAGSPYVETEHLLLGLLREDRQLANRFLRSHAAVESIRGEIESRRIAGAISTSVDLPLSHACKHALAYAAEEAEQLSHRHISTEHLLLGLLREEKGLASEILRERGLRLASLREALRAESPDSNLPDVRREAGRLRGFTARSFTLTAVKPQLTPADPANATGYYEGPGPFRDDPGPAAPGFGRLVTCRNMTMAQFAGNLPGIAPGYIRGATVIDATGLEGAWDFTLSFNVASMGGGGWGRGAGEASGSLPDERGAPTRNGELSLFDAIERQLGLKLEATDRPAPPPRSFPSKLSSPIAEVLCRATWLALSAKEREIGIDTLLRALDGTTGPPGFPDLSEMNATLTASTTEGHAYSLSVRLEISGEAEAAIGPLGGFGCVTAPALREALMAVRKRRETDGEFP